MHRYFVTGTDTDVGKTQVAAALALALKRAGCAPTIVKLVQTGVGFGDEGDAQRAGRLAGVPHVELARYRRPADPWSAAIAENELPLKTQSLVDALAKLGGSIVAEGSGGIAAPLAPREHLGRVAALSGLEAIVVVGLRLGCLNHALLTLDFCRDLKLPVAGAMLVERWRPTSPDYRRDVVRVLQESVPLLGIVPFASDESASVATGAKLFEPLVNQKR